MGVGGTHGQERSGRIPKLPNDPETPIRKTRCRCHHSSTHLIKHVAFDANRYWEAGTVERGVPSNVAKRYVANMIILGGIKDVDAITLLAPIPSALSITHSALQSPRTHQVCPQLRALAPAIPSTCNALSLVFYPGHSLRIFSHKTHVSLATL